MARRTVIQIGAALAIGLLVSTGLLVPAYLRAVDARVIEQAGRGTPSVVDAGQRWVATEKWGPAEMCLAVAKEQGVDGRLVLDQALQPFRAEAPPWGGPDPYLQSLLAGVNRRGPVRPQTSVEMLVDREGRTRLIEALRGSRRPVVQGFVQSLTLTNFVFLPPASSPGGQALEIGVGIAGLLCQGDYLTDSLREGLMRVVQDGVTSGKVGPLEEVYLDCLTLGQRLNWVQLTTLLAGVTDPQTLHGLAVLTQREPARLPTLYAGATIGGNTGETVRYLLRWGPSGFRDLGFALGHGKGSVDELVRRGMRIYHAQFRARFESWEPAATVMKAWARAGLSWPALVLPAKYALFFIAGLMLTWTFGRHPSEVDQKVGVPALAVARQWLFAVALVLVLMLLGEPFLARNIQGAEYPLHLRFPMIRNPVLTSMITPIKPYMDQLSLLALVVFFVMQLIMYVVNLMKLAEIRRQPVDVTLKLKLLENEDNMFDAGLYLGLGGSVLSLGFLALGIVKPSLATAYSSTLFGIIFVAVLKICHVRPLRRRLLLEKELAML